MSKQPVAVQEDVRQCATSGFEGSAAAAAPVLSKRADLIPASPIRKLTQFANDARARGIRVYHLNIGQPDIHTPKEFMEAVRKFPEKILAYGDSQGSRALRSAMLSYYNRLGLSLGELEMVVTMGASEALQFAYLATCDPGNEVIVFEPLYSNMLSYMAMSDIVPVPITLDPARAFELPSTGEIEAKITPRTRVIQICSPNNPTGTVISREDMQRLANLCRKHNLFLVSDEVYREFIYDARRHVSALDFPEIVDRAIVADSVSKRFSACGARIGAIISRNKRVIEAALRCAQARLCPPMLAQAGAAAAFHLPDSFFEPIVREYQARRDTLCRCLRQIPGIRSFVPAGSFYLMASIPVDSSETFCRWMLTDFQENNETVMFAPGPGFYASPGHGTREIRIAYVLNCEKIERSMALLAKALEVYPGRIPE